MLDQKQYGWIAQSLITTLAVIGLSACDKSSTDFSLMSASQTFSQGSQSVLNNQVDILWVVDNSASMDPLQQNLVSNFNSFISNFVTKGYDFHMAVTTSDAYLANSLQRNVPSYAKFRDGTNATSHSGVFIMTPSTPGLTSVFVTNATQGSSGSGDERTFSSFKESLSSSLNVGFLRPKSFLAVIILSDEDDFSNNSRPEWSGTDHSYSGVDSVDSYVSYLDTLTNSTAAHRRYNVSAITVKDNTCLNSHIQDAPSTIMGQRYIDIANKTNGTLGSICDSSYATALNTIQQHIAELSSQFYLDRQPVASSIKVVVNGATIANSATNGWTYDATANSIIFHGSAIPAQGAVIQVNYDPTSITL